jgi:hypothetical protein
LGFGAWDFAIASASASATRFAFASAARVKRILQVVGVRRVHTKNGALYIFHRADVNFVYKHIAKRDQTIQFIQKLGLLHLPDSLDEKLSVSGGTGEAQVFQQGDLTAT